MNANFTFFSASETANFAAGFAPFLKAGDVVLLSGEIGTGKTHFARSLIQKMQKPLGLLEDVPSPTFTLVQTYELGSQNIWHADLYRLTDGFEIVELGLVDAFETAICLVEWPDRLGDYTPTRYLALDFHQGSADNTRYLQIRAFGDGWDWLRNV